MLLPHASGILSELLHRGLSYRYLKHVLLRIFQRKPKPLKGHTLFQCIHWCLERGCRAPHGGRGVACSYNGQAFPEADDSFGKTKSQKDPEEIKSPRFTHS